MALSALSTVKGDLASGELIVVDGGQYRIG
jgi:hypothetical protein